MQADVFQGFLISADSGSNHNRLCRYGGDKIVIKHTNGIKIIILHSTNNFKK